MNPASFSSLTLNIVTEVHKIIDVDVNIQYMLHSITQFLKKNLFLLHDLSWSRFTHPRNLIPKWQWFACVI